MGLVILNRLDLYSFFKYIEQTQNNEWWVHIYSCSSLSVRRWPHARSTCCLFLCQNGPDTYVPAHRMKDIDAAASTTMSFVWCSLDNKHKWPGNKRKIDKKNILYERVWCTTQLAKLSFNHSHGRTHSWRFSTFYKIHRSTNGEVFEIGGEESTIFLLYVRSNRTA